MPDGLWQRIETLLPKPHPGSAGVVRAGCTPEIQREFLAQELKFGAGMLRGVAHTVPARLTAPARARSTTC
jgi:hypothetical protein